MNKFNNQPATIPACEYLSGSALPGNQSQLADHLIRLPGSSWALWRRACLRGAGFPADQVLSLTFPGCAAAADHVIDVKSQLQEANDRLVQAVHNALDELRANRKWDDKSQRRPLLDALHDSKRGKLPKLVNTSGPIRKAMEELRSVQAQAKSAEAEFLREFEVNQHLQSEAILELAEDDRFREAIIWQNRDAFHSCVERLLRNSPTTSPLGSKERQNIELMANYLQRYCVKNDTIGFFGPVGWARFDSRGEAIVIRPGPTLLAARSVYFEQWCIDAIADKIAESKALKPWLAPRRVPYAHIEGRTLYLAATRSRKLPQKQAAVLAACNGDQIAKRIAVGLVRAGVAGIESEQEVYEIIEHLTKIGLVLWTLEITVDTHPELVLRRLLDRIEDEQLRRSALDRLNQMEAARDSVRAAAGDAAKLNTALADLESVFTRLTGEAPTRALGEMYAGRTLVYEDCRRDIEVHLGPEILNSLGPPLSLILTSARWLTYQVAKEYRKIFEDEYSELARKVGSSKVNAFAFWMRVLPILYESGDSPHNIILSLFQKRWADILSIQKVQSHASFSSEQLRAKVMSAFYAPHPGWQAARHHSPDIMIAARSPEAIRRGEYELVMGEIHIAVNTLGAALFIAQHPNPEELYRAFESDLSEPRLVPVISKSAANAALRTRYAVTLPGDVRVAFNQDSFDSSGTHSLPIAAFIIDESATGLVVKARDGHVLFDIVEAFGDALSVLSMNMFKLLPAAAHTPRVSIDRLVVARESWSFSASELSFAFEKQEAARFLGARQWSRALKLPRFLFAKAPIERKPLYVDFESPIYVDNFAKVIRRSVNKGTPDALVTLTEMLPDINQTWLPDAQGLKYTSEIRIVAVDRAINSVSGRTTSDHRDGCELFC